jgi:hypothetical protein
MYSIARAIFNVSIESTACKALRAGFVIVDIFVQREAGEEELVDCICILDVIAYLTIDDSCGMN